MPAVAMTDHANLMFFFVRDILYHNKAAEAKIKRLLKMVKNLPKFR
jgi:DNA polymerase-3 subunit alpha